MSELTGYECDGCGKHIQTCQKNSIWIRVSMHDIIVIGKGGHAGRSFDRLDFCSTECMIKFIKENIP